MKARRFFFMIPLFLAVCLTALVLPQGRTANIAGVVTDSTGGVLPGVEVTVRNVETGITQDLLTDDEGRYQVRNLRLGTYEVEASLAGFQTSVRSGITLTVGRSAVVDLTLQVGEITERVVVTGEAPLINTTSAELSGLVDAKKIRDLPLNGRSFDQLAQLQPGVSAYRHTSIGGTGNSAGGLRITVAGARPTQNNWVMDGTVIMDQSNSTPGSATGNNLGLEAILEFEVLTSTYSAAFGGRSGGTINIVTRSGTNEYHGSVFEFHRNDNLDATPFFSNSRGQDKEEFKRNQFGFALGGPIIKDRTFAFGTYEGLRERVARSSVRNVPTALAKQGIFPGGVILPVAPVSIPYLNLYPLPNGEDFGDGTGEFISSSSREVNEDYFSIRLDHEFSDSDSLFGRYTYNASPIISIGGLELFKDVSRSRLQYVTIEEKHIFSPSLLNTFNVGFNRSYREDDSEDLVDIDPSLSFIPGRRLGNISFSFGGVGGAISGIGAGGLGFTAFNLWQLSDNVNYTRGAHTLLFGVNVGRLQHNFTNAVFIRGTFLFRALEDFITGANATEFRGYHPDGNIFRGIRLTTLGLYVQDDFQVRPGLTINAGVRLQTQSAPSEVNGLQSNIPDIDSSPAVIGLPYFGQPGYGIEPRFGFAWDPFGTGKTSIRGGAGFFHDNLMGNVYVNSGTNDPFFTQVAALDDAPFPNAFDIIDQAQLGGAARGSTIGGLPAIITVALDAKMPSRLQYNLNVQHEVMPNTMVLVAYVGALGRSGVRTSEANAAFPDKLPDGSSFWPAGRDISGAACTPGDPAAPATCEAFKRRNSNFSSHLRHSTDANSVYNSLQLMLNRRFSEGYQFQFSYTWSHSIDENSQQWGSEGRNNPQNSLDTDNSELDRGPSIFDLRHNLTFNATYEFPFMQNQSTPLGKILGGWQLNALVSLVSGFTLTPALGFNNSRNFDLRNPERPDLVSGRDNNPTEGTTAGCGSVTAGSLQSVERWFDPCAYAIPTPGTFGNAGRGTVRGPGYANVDLGLVKTTRVSETVSVQFRAEAFNAFNRTNLGRPSASIFTSSGNRRGSSGRISSTLSRERQIQLGLKIIF